MPGNNEGDEAENNAGNDAGPVALAITEKLKKEFAPLSFQLDDLSSQHEGHSGAHAEGESHFHLYMVADAFSGLNAVARQRAVYQLLEEELKNRIHAFSMTLHSKEEVDDAS